MSLLIQVVGRTYFLVVVGLRSPGPCWMSAEGTCIPWLVAFLLHLQSQHGRRVPLTFWISCATSLSHLFTFFCCIQGSHWWAVCLVSPNQGKPWHKDDGSRGTGRGIWQEEVEVLHVRHWNGLPVRYDSRGAALPFPPLLFWTLNLLHENMKKALLASCWAGCSREQLWFHRNRTCFFYIYLISLWQLVLFYLTFCWYSFFLLLFWSKKIAFRNNAFLSDLYFYQFVICSVLTFVSPSSISPCIRITHLSFFLEFSCLLSVLVSSPFVFLFSLLGMILCIFPSL